MGLKCVCCLAEGMLTGHKLHCLSPALGQGNVPCSAVGRTVVHTMLTGLNGWRTPRGGSGWHSWAYFPAQTTVAASAFRHWSCLGDSSICGGVKEAAGVVPSSESCTDQVRSVVISSTGMQVGPQLTLVWWHSSKISTVWTCRLLMLQLASCSCGLPLPDHIDVLVEESADWYPQVSLFPWHCRLPAVAPAPYC